MPQISASVNQNTIDAITRIRETEKLSFSQMVDAILARDPEVKKMVKQLKEEKK